MKTILFIFIFNIGNLAINSTSSSYNDQALQHITFISKDSNTKFIDTVIYWRTEEKINKVMALYVSHLRNNNMGYMVEKTIRVVGEMNNGQMNGFYSFFNSQNHELIARAMYKKGKLCGDVLIFDKGKVVAHYIFKKNKCLGLCDKEGVLLKIRHHIYYYPKKKCFCRNI